MENRSLLQMLCNTFDLDEDVVQLPWTTTSEQQAFKYISAYCAGKMYLNVRAAGWVFMIISIVLAAVCLGYAVVMWQSGTDIYSIAAMLITAALMIMLGIGLRAAFMWVQLRGISHRLCVYNVVHLKFNMNELLSIVMTDYNDENASSDRRDVSRYSAMMIASFMERQSKTLLKLGKNMGKYPDELQQRITPQMIAALGLCFDAPIGCYVVELECLMPGSQREIVCVVDDVTQAIAASIMKANVIKAASDAAEIAEEESDEKENSD